MAVGVRNWLQWWGSWAGAWLGWLGLLTWLSSQSQPGPAIAIRHVDKGEHFIYFAAGGVALAGALALRGRQGLGEASGKYAFRREGLLVLVVGCAIGWLDEWHQSFVPGRVGLDLGDWLADAAGSLLAAVAARPLLRWAAKMLR
jgi:VanZ family protein